MVSDDENQIYYEEYPEGDYAEVIATDKWVEFEIYDTIDRKSGRARFTRDEAIAAARAILKHFGEVAE